MYTADPLEGTSPATVIDEGVRVELGSRFDLGVCIHAFPDFLVCRARELATGRQVLLRLTERQSLRGRENAVRDMMAEVAGLDHPHLASVVGAGTTARYLWSATEFPDGATLADLLRTTGTMDLKRCLRIVEQIASALHYAHRRGIVHGDVRSANVLVRDGDWALLAGFGPTAVDPATDRPDPSDDQAGLAVMVAECLTGARPVPDSLRSGSAAEWLAVLLADDVGLPPHLTATLRQAASPVATTRFPTILDFVAALHASPEVRHPAPRSVPPTASDFVVLFPDSETTPRSRLLLGGLVVLVALVGGGAALVSSWIDQPRHNPQPPEALALQPAPAPAPPVPPPEAKPAVSVAVIARRPSPELARTTRPDRREPRDRSNDAPRPADTASAVAPVPPPSPDTQVVPAGRLFVSSRPWGHVYVDDQPVGTTPKASLPITAGRHRIRIVREGFVPFEREILVGPAEEVRLIDVILEKGGGNAP